MSSHKKRHSRHNKRQRGPLPENMVTLYADASHKDGVFAWSFWARAAWGRHIASGICPPDITTINEAELYAICQGMHRCVKHWPLNPIAGWYVRSDSKTSVNILAGRCQPKGVAIRLMTAAQPYLQGRKMNAKWVRGHAGNGTTKGYLNNQVDALARKARVAATQQ